jgi:hypothetical protein
MYKDRHIRVEVVCGWCGNVFMAQQSRIKKGQGRFCSLEHFNEWQKDDGKKTWGKENGKTYWDGSGWKLHYADETGRWRVMSYPKYLWEINCGEIPSKHLVSFLDGNPYNVNLDNLYLITRSELSAIQGKKQLGVPKPTIAGENSKWWRGGVSQGGYPQTFTKPLKKRIKIRDNYTCQCCYSGYSTENLDVHHIDRDMYNNEPENLVTVCKSCHKGIHGKSSKTNDKIRYYQSLLGA